MKSHFIWLLLLTLLTTGRAATTITGNSFAYGANLGWLDCRGDVTSGAVIGQFTCSGYIYSANVGWICLGSGAPTNGIQYQNLSANDFGVNTDTSGNLRGYAYSANVGWIKFETNGAPVVDLETGILSGSVWSANCGWISLNNAFAYVETSSLNPGTDTDGDGLPDAWERQYFFGSLTNVAAADSDGDGMSNLSEYLTGTNPNNAASVFRITSITRNQPFTDLTWPAHPSFFYDLEYRPAFATNISWTIHGHTASPGLGGISLRDSNTNDFYRVRPFRPLLP